MKKYLSFCILAVILINGTTSSSNGIYVIDSHAEETEDKLVSVAVLYRHGDRSPITSYPNDPYYDSSYWPEGYGQLLNKGKSRQYALGKWFRARYSSFLSEVYSRKEIRVLSSDIDRTLMSAAANLAGLFPPIGSRIWKEDLLWQPIPIHTTPLENDNLIAMGKKCPKYDKLFSEFISSDYVKNLTVEYSDLLEYVSNHTGWSKVNIDQIVNLQSVFYVYKQHNESFIPSWAAGIDQEKFEYLTGLAWTATTFTQDLKRLKTGPFFNYLITHFEGVIANSAEASKFLMLSGHDSTIASVLNGMGSFDFHAPEFASTIIWELHRKPNGTHFFNLFYKKYTDTNQTEKIVLNGCYFNCDYQSFKTILEPINTDATTWNLECTSATTTNVL